MLSKAVVTNEGRLKYRDVVKLIEADGWFWVRTNGSHQIYHHPTKLNIVVVPAHNMGRDVKPGLPMASSSKRGYANVKCELYGSIRKS